MNIEPQWLAGLVGVVSPFMVRWITRTKLSRRRKSLIAIIVSSVIGFASSFLSGQFDPSVILQSIAVAFSISQLFYDQVFKGIFVNKNNE
jgi:hypothetical protein